ncbi:hypothetical protein CLOHYLEM_07259 [[Clostridium] hylemonae DSM 15053]|uniref:Uncharacterized protein n=1 Tax=[Clostridium] hylemonae DSM 15053 TaxID=553973 RepID=C0C584_9FIRM|nr:hypothetical protein CLOHYLEM_07259 [[Clostridium] hylemonae DSM 15053]
MREIGKGHPCGDVLFGGDGTAERGRPGTGEIEISPVPADVFRVPF